MKDLELGKILKEEQQRDAIHVAIAPVIATERLVPGDHIGFVDDTHTEVTVHTSNKIGIVDPFLTTKVMPGERFWMFLYPQTITSLRHDWTHPAFEVKAKTPEMATYLQEGNPAKAHSRDWLVGFTSKYGVPYDALIEAWNELLENDGNYFPHGPINAVDLDLSNELEEELRTHLGVVTGKITGNDISPFRCSC